MLRKPPYRASQTLFLCSADRTIPLQATRVLLTRAPTTLLLHRRAGLTRPNAVSHRWASVEPSPTGHPKTTKFTTVVGGAHSCMPNRSLRARRPPPACHTSYSSELAPARFQMRIWGGGNLSLAAVLHSIAFWGFTGSGPFPARSPPPGQHAYNVLPYTSNTHYVYRASRCKCEIVKNYLVE